MSCTCALHGCGNVSPMRRIERPADDDHRSTLTYDVHLNADPPPNTKTTTKTAVPRGPGQAPDRRQEGCRGRAREDAPDQGHGPEHQGRGRAHWRALHRVGEPGLPGGAPPDVPGAGRQAQGRARWCVSLYGGMVGRSCQVGSNFGVAGFRFGAGWARPWMTYIHQPIYTRHAAKPKEPITITLPDGSVKEGTAWVTTPYYIAAGIAQGLADSAVVAKVSPASRHRITCIHGLIDH